MATSTNIVLAGTGIVAVNDWYQTNTFPWRIGIAGLLLSLFMAGAEEVSKPIAIGLSLAYLGTVLVTPMHGNSPVAEVAHLFNSPPTTKA